MENKKKVKELVKSMRINFTLSDDDAFFERAQIIELIEMFGEDYLKIPENKPGVMETERVNKEYL